MHKATVVLLACTVVAGCGGTTTTTTSRAGVETTVVSDGQWVIVLLTASTALVSSILTAWLSSYFSSKSERDKRISEDRSARETRTREQIGEVADQISLMMQEFSRYFDQYEDGVNVEAAEALDAVSRLARRFRFESLGKVGVLEDKVLRQLAEAVFGEHELVAAEMATSIVDGAPGPDSRRMEHARDAFFERAREVIANL